MSSEEAKYGSEELKENESSKVNKKQRPATKSCKEKKEYMNDGQDVFTMAIPKCIKDIKENKDLDE